MDYARTVYEDFPCLEIIEPWMFKERLDFILDKENPDELDAVEKIDLMLVVDKVDPYCVLVRDDALIDWVKMALKDTIKGLPGEIKIDWRATTAYMKEKWNLKATKVMYTDYWIVPGEVAVAVV